MLKLMTFNIRYGTAMDGKNHWVSRKHLVLERIKAFDPDILGMQECRDDFQGEFIRNNLREYAFYGIRRGNGGDTALEMTPILFKRSIFKLSQKGCFWLSETPQVSGSQSWGGVFPRTAIWVQLVHQKSGREFIFINTHFDYKPSAINGSARLVQQWAMQAVKNYPTILTGDFNATKSSSAYKQLTMGAGLTDIYRQIYSNNNDEGTFHGFGKVDELAPIDWILASNQFEVVSAEIDRHHECDRYPSDHFPVIALLNWKQEEKISNL